MTARTTITILMLAALGQAQTQWRERVSAAQRQIQNRQWNEARAMLQKLDADCLAERDSNSCRPLVDYAIGYLNQQQAGTLAAESRGPLLTEARKRYENVVRLEPYNGATLNSLALVEQALRADARTPQEQRLLFEDIVEHWTNAINAGDRNSVQYRVSLGNFLAPQYPAAALDHYQRAAEQMPGDESLRRRILELSGGRPASDYENLCASWEGEFAALAAQCYERLMARLHAQEQNDGQPSEDILVRWTSLESRQDALSLGRLNLVPAGWMTVAVDELKAYVGNPLNQRVWSWWWKSQNRAAVTAEVATTMGRQRLGDPGGPQFAAACWEGLLKARPQLAEEVGEFSMRPGSGGGGLEGVLRLYEELTSLYFRNGELDPYGSKLNAWVNELFQGKGHFILERNWKAAQPYHTVLAHIFVQRGILDKGFGSAAYQLRAVLEDADRRWQDPQERFFQPLPEIRMLLAETYQKLGGARQDDAMAMYIQAAEAYLDTDALDSSQLMLNAAAKARAAAQRSAVGQINQIVNARRGASNLAAAKVALDAPWLNSTSVLVTADFLARQRFKLLADAAAGAEAGERLDAALRSYNLVTGSRPVLVGTADLVRWQQVESRLLAGINAQSARPVIRAASGGISAANLRLTLQSENHPFEIAVAGDTKLAAQVVSTLGVIDTLKARLYLTPRLGKIVVTAPSDQMNALRGIVGKMREAQIPLSVMSERGPA